MCIGFLVVREYANRGVEYAFLIPRWAGALTLFWRTFVLYYVSDPAYDSLSGLDPHAESALTV